MFVTDKIRIPSVLRGLEYFHSIKGKLPWRSLVEPGASLAKNNGKFNKRLMKNHGLDMKKLGETLDLISQHGTNSNKFFFNEN